MSALPLADAERPRLLTAQTRQLYNGVIQFATQANLDSLDLITGVNYRLYGDLINYFITHDIDKDTYSDTPMSLNQYRSQEQALLQVQQHDQRVQIHLPSGKNDDVMDTFFRLNNYQQGDKIGRFYFNFHPDQVIQGTQQLIEQFKEKGIPCDVKVGNARQLETHHKWEEYTTGSDKVVLYFNPQQQQEVLQLIKEFALINASLLETTINKCAIQIRDDQGVFLPGIGFGEEPDQEAIINGMDVIDRNRTFSFTQSRSILLLYFLRLRQDFGQKIGLDALFIRAAERFGIDPLNPAFNRDTAFPIIKKADAVSSGEAMMKNIRTEDHGKMNVVKTIEYQGARKTRRIIEIEGKPGLWIEIPLYEKPTRIEGKEYAGGEQTVKRVRYAGLVAQYLLNKLSGTTIQIPNFTYIKPSLSEPLGILCSQYFDDVVKGGEPQNIVMPEDCTNCENAETNSLMIVLNQMDTGLLNRLRRKTGQLVLIDFEATGGLCCKQQPFFVTKQDVEISNEEITTRYQNWMRLCKQMTDEDLFKTQAEFLLIALEAGYREGEIQMVTDETIENIKQMGTIISHNLNRKNEIRNGIERRQKTTSQAVTPKFFR